MSAQPFGQVFLEHLDQVVRGDTSLDRNVVDSFRRLLPSISTSRQERVELALKLYGILPAINDDPTPINDLIEMLLDGCPLEDILQIQPPLDLAAGLDLRAAPFHLLTLSILAKGIQDIAPVRRLAATQPETFLALVRLWLCAQDTAVSTKCHQVLTGLLRADRALDGSGILPSKRDDPTGLSSLADCPVWKRLFQDSEVYNVFYDATSLTISSIELSKNQRTLAQARLMDFLSLVGKLDWTVLTASHLPEVESRYGLEREQGLLHYAALHMVDIKDDVLMHRNLIKFLQDVLAVFSHDECYRTHADPSPALTFLIDNGLHERVVKLFTDPQNPSHDPVDITFLYSAAGAYIQTYLVASPCHFEASQSTRFAVLARLATTLNMPNSRWQYSALDATDIGLVAALPPTLLLPPSNSDPQIPFLPTHPPDAAVFTVLSKILSGHQHDIPTRAADRTASRNLYLLYLRHNPRLWTDVIKAAETVAMKDTALAAIALVHSLAVANWPGYSPASPHYFSTDNSDSDSSMTDLGTSNSAATTTTTPQTGIEALTTSPALAAVLPWLLRQNQTFSNVPSGGVSGDAKSAANEIATAKWECMHVIKDQLRVWTDAGGPAVEARRAELDKVAEALEKRAMQGVRGRSRGIGGPGEVATLEL
jgi:hypothetical protein